jgi:antitoxin component YwqK of YwqJK toxin-antitoxin module
MVRVPYDDLDFPGWDDGYTYNGESFTGVAFELGEGGRLVAEVEFRSGIQEGMWREWHPDGVPSREARLERGVWHGHCREWHPNGQLALEGEWEYGVSLHRRRWDEAGVLAEEYEVASNASASEVLGIYRRMYGGSAQQRQAEPGAAADGGA